jgi:hypothetical protein
MLSGSNPQEKPRQILITRDNGGRFGLPNQPPHAEPVCYHGHLPCDGHQIRPIVLIHSGINNEAILASETGFWLIGDPHLLVCDVTHQNATVLWWFRHSDGIR